MQRNAELGRRDFLKIGASSVVGLAMPTITASQVTQQTAVYRRIDAYLHSVTAIDTHDHLRPFNALLGYVETDRGPGMNLYGLWNTSYYPRTNRLTTWNPGETFDAWWGRAKHDFDNARATTFYRYMLPAFQSLYGVDFDRITDAQAGSGMASFLDHNLN